MDVINPGIPVSSPAPELQMSALLSVKRCDFSERRNDSNLTELLKPPMYCSAVSNPFGFTDLAAITALADSEQITDIN